MISGFLYLLCVRCLNAVSSGCIRQPRSACRTSTLLCVFFTKIQTSRAGGTWIISQHRPHRSVMTSFNKRSFVSLKLTLDCTNKIHPCTESCPITTRDPPCTKIGTFIYRQVLADLLYMDIISLYGFRLNIFKLQG